MGSQWKSMTFVSGNADPLPQQHGWERWMFLWNANQAKQGKHGSNSPSQSLVALPFRNPERQTGNWQTGCWTAACVAGVKKRGCSKDTRGCGCQEALLCDNHSLGWTSHPTWAGEAKKATGWGPSRTEADTSFTLMHREKLNMTFLRSCTLCGKVQTS